MGDYYAAFPTITVPGNHEMKGDWGFVSFAQRFNMPDGDSGTEFDTPSAASSTATPASWSSTRK